MILASLSSWLSTYAVHPLSGLGYQFWSGIGSDLSEVTLIGFALAAWRHHNCHVHHCFRLQWHADPDTGHPVCRRHHPDPHGYLDGSIAAPHK